MPKYIKCPRCELNYILESEKLCPVCQAELKLSKDDSLSDDMELCPICGQNFVSYDQPMCEECAKKRSLDDIVDEDDGYEREEASEFSDLDANDGVDDDIVPFADLDEDDDEDEDLENEDSAVDSANYDDFEDDFDYNVDDYDDEDDDEDEDDEDDDEDDDD